MTPLPPLKDVIARYGVDAKKSLGQHFLLDGNVTAKIARINGSLSALNVIEIGPGPGGLTRALLEAGAKHVHAIEKDARCVAALAELQKAYPQLHVIEADALAVDLPQRTPAPRAVIANLPYNIGTALLLQWLKEIAENPQCYAFLTLMFQKEVAERIAAAPGGKAYGRLSVLAQWLCRVQPAFDLPPGAFSPPPKIHSSVIVLTPRPEPLSPAARPMLEKVLAAGFGQRRKMLRASLRPLGGEALLTAAGIDPQRRPEQLSVEEWCRLAAMVKNI
ncbi:MAG: 16S rRNA (adenine(1518)-N(6)/adenine(1519)-N(6))-dimethyltransferase RsmA [Alphaproteobacteria bacterium]|nr:16S rRNA (adenine(1518)-N(6)/adenine(1519)-N(6))-dimethyltransferase RsmA [Alphaproteobacteria bacterium]